ncbi:MAG: hypothetical protein JO189_21355 [Deltaproteobacteria bacterium]|nr:hypothetical protein [Deltaproteobacteria bacterium]
MSHRRTAHGFSELVDAAALAIGAALHDGEGQDPVGTWLTESIENQLRHIEAPITAY